MKSSKDGTRCYMCGCIFKPDYIFTHVRLEHTNEEKSLYIAQDLLDMWKEERQIQQEELAIERR